MYSNKVFDYGAGVGQVGLFLIIIVIFFDVVGAKLFRMPIYGAGDIVGITQLLAVSIALPQGLIKGVHPRVTFFVNFLGARAQRVLEFLMNVIGTLLFALLTVMTFKLALQYQGTNEFIGNISFPIYPFIYLAAFFFAFGCLAWLLSCLLTLRLCGRSQ